MRLYRYEYTRWWRSDPSIDLIELEVIKETPNGYWVKRVEGMFSTPKRWMNKTARRRYAWPTKEEAINSLIKRTEKQLQIIRSQERTARTVLWKAKEIRDEQTQHGGSGA